LSKRIYLAHCSARKDITLKDVNKNVTPDKLYTATPTQRFMKSCMKNNVEWAIFSDYYGIWFSKEKNRWYEKSPDSVTDKEFDKLVANLNSTLRDFDEIWFYYNPGRFHKLYRKLLHRPEIRNKIKYFTHLSDIKKDKK
jgi:hypothetical protein